MTWQKERVPAWNENGSGGVGVIEIDVNLRCCGAARALQCALQWRCVYNLKCTAQRGFDNELVTTIEQI